jgi:hypothetical protein
VLDRLWILVLRVCGLFAHAQCATRVRAG